MAQRVFAACETVTKLFRNRRFVVRGWVESWGRLAKAKTYRVEWIDNGKADGHVPRSILENMWGSVVTGCVNNILSPRIILPTENNETVKIHL